MKMPEGPIRPELFAPCGMNCMVCYKHCFHKRPCGGCRSGGVGKPEHCRKCAIRDCLQKQGRSHCFECPDFPCKRIRNLDASYRRRYQASLVENSRYVQQHGLEAFMAQQKQTYTCPRCGGVLSLHDKMCSECHSEP